MPRTYVKFGEWDKAGLKTPKHEGKVDENKRESQRVKFARCKNCGGQMTYITGSNILICQNEVEKKKTKIDETGNKVEYTITEVCGNVNMVDAQYQGYMSYLFD